MSYEGFEQQLCANGHLTEQDAWSDLAIEACPRCGAAFVWSHTVDETNGYDEAIPETCRWPLRVERYEDVWHEDHYGNRYATRLPVYQIPTEAEVNERCERMRRAYREDMAALLGATGEE